MAIIIFKDNNRIFWYFDYVKLSREKVFHNRRRANIPWMMKSLLLLLNLKRVKYSFMEKLPIVWNYLSVSLNF